MPETVSVAASTDIPVIGEFRTVLLTAGASNEKTGWPVPVIDPTETVATPRTAIVCAALRHARLVADLHELVAQLIRATAAVAVWSPQPKFSPLTVSEVNPLWAAFA